MYTENKYTDNHKCISNIEYYHGPIDQYHYGLARLTLIAVKYHNITATKYKGRKCDTLLSVKCDLFLNQYIKKIILLIADNFIRNE